MEAILPDEFLRIEALVEDRSGTVLLRHLLERYFADRAGTMIPHKLYLRPHKGLGNLPQAPEFAPGRHKYGLLHLLPAKLRAYEKVLNPQDSLLLIVLDADENDPARLRQQLQNLLGMTAPDHPCIIAIAIEELEAWLLGDFAAIKAAYPEADYNRYRRYRQDAVCGTWELLAEVILGKQARRLIRAGYPAVGEYKHRWAEKIAPNLVLDRNRSPSLQLFLAELEAYTDAWLKQRNRGHNDK